jgi:lipoate---protein ligase
MLIMYRTFTDPYFNIAAEEYFIKHVTEDICMVWVNKQSVIIGKHQNAFAEINYPFIRESNIPVIRRVSGGGAVYHDTGNINFSFIRKTNKENPVNFKEFTEVIINFMQSIGIKVTTNKRNSLFVNELKFSGHAEHIFHDKVLHHGTILFDTDLTTLKNSLTAVKNFQSKALPSVSSSVGNIAPLLSEKIDIQQFTEKLLHFLINYYPHSARAYLTEDNIQSINKLADEKYRTWQWNFGYSPSYSFKVEFNSTVQKIIFFAKVENGHFVKIDFQDSCVKPEIENIILTLIGKLHNENDINLFIKNNREVLEHAGVNTVIFRNAFFS